jgi:cytoskeletal protein CcmA (bactofilin family)
MECYSEQVCAIFVDGELPVEEARRLRDHLATCPRCQRLVDALRIENRVLGESLNELPEEATGSTGLPRLRLSWVWGDVAAVSAVLALWCICSIWLDELRIPEALKWLNPFSADGLTNLIFSLSYYFAHGGAVMLANYGAIVGGLFLLLAGGALLLGRRWRLHHPGLRLLIVLFVLSLPGFALERRHGEFVTVAANETVDDTLLAAGNTVSVEGVVNGDLLVFAQTLEVRGTVNGDLVSFAKRTVVSGTVEGRIYDFSQSLDLEGQLGHSIYAWAQSFRLDDRAHVGEGVVVGGADASLEGEVKRSVTIFAGNANVSGSVGRDLTMAGSSLTLTDTARVGGDLIARVHEMKDVHVAEGATITGKRDIQVRVRKNQFTRPRFYLHQAIWLAAAMLVGWLGVVLFPGFFQACTQAVGSGWRSLGLGVAVLAGVPLGIVIAGITLVGIPVSLMLLAVYLAAIYLAKIWVGAFLGRILLRPAAATKRDWLLGLLVGLLILTVIGFVPYVGGLVRLAALCLGLGAFSWQLYRVSRPALTT